MKPLTETVLSALLLALGVFLYVFRVKGFLLLHLPAETWYMPKGMEQVAAVVSLGVGAYFAVGLCAAYPAWRKALACLTGALLAGEVALFLIGFGGIIR